MPWEDMEHVITLWIKPTRSGGTIISGAIAPLPYEQIGSLSGNAPAPRNPFKVGTDNAPVVVDHRSIILFPAKKTSPRQPDYYGWAHSGQPTRPAVKLSIWTRNDENGRVYLIGNTEEADSAAQMAPAPEAKKEQNSAKPSEKQPRPSNPTHLHPPKPHKGKSVEDSALAREDESGGHEPSTA